MFTGIIEGTGTVAALAAALALVASGCDSGGNGDEDAGAGAGLYAIRLARGQTSFEDAVRNSRLLFDSAKRAGVQRIVHVSITKADQAPYLSYFAGKAEVEASLKESGVSYAVVRPTVVYGREDVLINNIAWLLRRIPIFVIAACIRWTTAARVSPRL